MDNFAYARPRDMEAALRLGSEPDSQFIAGGTNLLDLMKGGVQRASRLVDITQVAGLSQIAELPDGGLQIGAMARNSAMAAHPLVVARYPLLSQALVAGASPQLRNMASAAGNILQRTRCYYFYDTGFKHCNKRDPGSGCDALQGFNRIHAILGASEACIATNPSDLGVALYALDATVQVRSLQGSRRIPIAEFHRLPGDTPQFDNVLAPGEMVVSIDLPPSRFPRHAHYLKVRDRASYAFALVSVAVGIERRGAAIEDARVVLGSVAHKPWIVTDAAAILKAHGASESSFAQVAEAAVMGAAPQRYNAFKIELAQRAVVRALQTAYGTQTSDSADGDSR